MRLTQAIRAPTRTLITLSSTTVWPWSAWVPLGLIAVVGSLVYGASLALRLPWSRSGSAWWLTLGSGLGWLVLGPVLRKVTGLPWRVLGHACLVTMAYGEGVLMLGAALNAWMPTSHPGLLNAGIVLTSNVIMGAALARLLSALGVQPLRTWACWTVALNGSGGLFFLLLRFLLAR